MIIPGGSPIGQVNTVELIHVAKMVGLFVLSALLTAVTNNLTEIIGALDLGNFNPIITAGWMAVVHYVQVRISNNSAKE